jgi:preprotein translocase subunit SecD
MKRKYWVSLLGIIIVAAASVAYVVSKDWKPQLGLDLKGGSEIVLQPKGNVSGETVTQAKDIILNRVDALGVSEPDVHLEGSSIIVELPGVTDEKRAESLVGQTAKLTFRKVLGTEPADPTNTSTSSTTAPKTTTTTAAQKAKASTKAKTSTGSTTTTKATTTTTVAPPATPTTPREESGDNKIIVLPADPNSPTGPRYQLDKPILTGKDIKTASVGFDSNSNERTVQMKFKGGKSTDTWKTFTAANVNNQVAIVLDGEVKSAPNIQEAFTSGDVQITSNTPGGYGEKEAKDLVSVLKYGALPVALTTESVNKVSATLGQDALRAGLTAGLIGLGLVLLYIIFYYRALGIVTLLGLLVSTSLLYSIICILGHTRGLALSLAGVTGIIVSVGVTVDSYIVYFEKLKDEIRAGRSVRASVERGFKSAFRTILAADFSSLIGAAVLYYLSIGPVRGFAFFLGLSTLLDIVVAYFFTRPMVILLGQSRVFTEMRGLGVARGLAAEEVAA